MESVEEILESLLQAGGLPFSEITRSEVAGQTVFTIETDDDSRALIGTHGDTIHAIDHIVKKIVENRYTPALEADEAAKPPLFLVDVGDYRAKQIRDLQTRALMMAERARSFQYDVELSPMSAYERLIIHTTLQDAPNIKTESRGEGRGRRLVIKYAS